MPKGAPVGAQTVPSTLNTGIAETQREWHEAYRDMMQDMYRTSYVDMVSGREVAVKSDFPSGYGGHVPSLRHDALFRETKFDRTLDALRADPGRDTLPGFKELKDGVPAYTARPRGARKPETAFTHPGPPGTLITAPWAVTAALQEPPTFRNSPATMRLATPRINLLGINAPRPSTPRTNQAAKTAGQHALQADRPATAIQADTARSAEASARPLSCGGPLADTGERLDQATKIFNERAAKARAKAPTELEILRENLPRSP